jgi:hypothetical protein
MNEPATESSIQEISAKVDAVLLGLRYLFLSLIALASILNLWAAISIKTFAEIFRDALPGKPLPLLSSFVVHGSSFLVLLAFVWPVIGLFTHKVGKKPIVWIMISVAILFLIGVQIILTWIGCFTPMFGLIQGLPPN